MNKINKIFTVALLGLFVSVGFINVAVSGQAGFVNGLLFSENINNQTAKAAASTDYGDNLYTNASFDTWGAGVPTGWSTENTGGAGSDGAIAEENSIVHSGAAAVKFTNGDAGKGKIVEQSKIGLTPDDNYRTSFWARHSTNEPNVYYIAGNAATFATSTQLYDFVANGWVAFGGGQPPADAQVSNIPDAIAYQQFTSESVPVPASGILTFFYFPETGVENGILYIDDAIIEEVIAVPANQVTVTDFTNPSDASLFEATDYFLRARTTGGTPKNGLSMNGLGVFSTDFATYNFSSKPVQVGNATGGTHALNLQTSEGIVAVVGSIDLKATGQTTIYTVPTGYTFYPTLVYLESTSVDTLSVLSTLSMGVVGGGYNDIINGYTSLTLPTQGTKREITFNSDVGSFAAGSVIKLDVDTGSTATTHTGKIYLLGYLIAI